VYDKLLKPRQSCRITLYKPYENVYLAKYASCNSADNDESALFWVITQRLVVNSYRRFWTIDQSHPQGSRILNKFCKPPPPIKDLYLCTVHSVVYFSNTPTKAHIWSLIIIIYIQTLKTLLHVSIIRSSSWSILCSLLKLQFESLSNLIT